MLYKVGYVEYRNIPPCVNKTKNRPPHSQGPEKDRVPKIPKITALLYVK